MTYPYRRPGLFNEYIASNSDVMLSTDIHEKENEYVMNINVPGYAKEDLKMHLEKGYLTINAASHEEADDGSKLIRRERFHGNCSRRYYVGQNITEEDIKASCQNGVLTIHVPKVSMQQVKEIKYIPID